MKSVLTIIFFVLSMSVYATDPKGLVGEGVSGYAHCMKDIVDCNGCAKRCAEIYSSENSDPSRRNEPVKARKRSGQSTTVKQQ